MRGRANNATGRSFRAILAHGRLFGGGKAMKDDPSVWGMKGSHAHETFAGVSPEELAQLKASPGLGDEVRKRLEKEAPRRTRVPVTQRTLSRRTD